jgi:DNA-binding TFAR19-related protein (PDSD5 family)
MSEEDPDINIIKARKMKEMRELAASMEKVRMKKEDQKNRSKTSSEIISGYLYDRGQEVLNLAESQFPLQTKAIINRIVELINTGEINQRISGGELLALFRAVGINVRVTTSIKIEDHGKMVSFSDKLKQEKDDTVYDSSD